MGSVYLWLGMCGVLAWCAGGGAVYLPEVKTSNQAVPVDDKSNKFVNRIKENLRRNNDDYAEATAGGNLTSVGGNATSAVGLVSANRRTLSMEVISTGRTDVSLVFRPAALARSRVTHVLRPALHNDRPLEPIVTFKRAERTTADRRNSPQPSDESEAVFEFPGPDDDPMLDRRQKIDKLKKFIYNNKNLLMKLSERKVTTARPRQQPPKLSPVRPPRPAADAGVTRSMRPALRQRPPRPGPRPLRPGPRPPRPGPHPPRPGRARPALALPHTDAPDARQLDMAPARGAHISALRLKGRLCQRNVLIPEGPKYDSKGVVYLRQFNKTQFHKDYAHTRPPLFLLPRCCNCCKKSVLGCE